MAFIKLTDLFDNSVVANMGLVEIFGIWKQGETYLKFTSASDGAGNRRVLFVKETTDEILKKILEYTNGKSNA